MSPTLRTVVALSVFTCSLASAPLSRAAEATAAAGDSVISLEIRDITPKFLAFYEAAEKEKASPDRRWELWKEMYDFAAVPPTEEGQKIARKMLDEAWPRYASALDVIRRGAAGLTPDPHAAVRSIAELLKAEKPAKVRLRVYVGAFENNAFTMAQGDNITTSIPIEMDPEPRALIMTHELAHAVHIAMGTFSGGWIRSVGATVVSEGVSLHVTRKLFPNASDADVAEHTKGWLKAADEKRREILRGILPALTSDKSEDVMRFTMGKGTAGLEREAYYAGWVIVGEWLREGMTLADVARIPEKETPQRVAATIERLLKQP
jgi:hypothetical protein